MLETVSVSELVNAFYDSGCTDPHLLTTREAEPWRDEVKWVDAAFKRAQMHEPDFAVFGHFRDRNAAVLDVGANSGYSVSSMCAAGCKAAVLSLEVMPWYREHLARVRARDPQRFDFRITGVGSHPSTLRFVTPVINGIVDSALTSADEATHREHLFRNIEAVMAAHNIALPDLVLKFIVTHQSVATLDQIVAEYDGNIDLTRIDAIKIDVEGYEAEVLSGARTLLAAHRPLIMLEGANRSAAVREIMSATGYCHARRHGAQLQPDDAISMEANGYFLPAERLPEYRDIGLAISSRSRWWQRWLARPATSAGMPQA